MTTVPNLAAADGVAASTETDDQIQLAQPTAARGLPLRARRPRIAKNPEIEAITRPLLKALAKLAGMESTYLTVFDWARREEEIRFVFSAGDIRIEEGQRSTLPATASPEAFPRVTRAPPAIGKIWPHRFVKPLSGFAAYVSVPVTVGGHHLFGMLCGCGRNPQKISDAVVNLMESFARIIEDRVVRAEAESSESRASLAESQLVARVRFIAEAEHRLKTPLAVLEGLSLTLLDRWEDLSAAERTEFHAGIARNSRLLSHEVDGLLAEARADMQTRELRPVHLDLAPVIRVMALSFDGLRASHRVIAEPSDEVVAFVDPRAIEQILGHLLDNAIKYSPNGGRITIRASKAAGSVSIDVADEGLGLPPGIDVFEPFLRGDLRDGGTPGIGLGLHIVRKLVQAMGGSVRTRGNSGPGSTFTVNVPAGH